ncbi:hypothetical protein GCM10009625_22210 [Brachybacterium fresconis]
MSCDLGPMTSGADGGNAPVSPGTSEALEDETGPTPPLDPFDGGVDLHVVDEEYV